MFSAGQCLKIKNGKSRDNGVPLDCFKNGREAVSNHQQKQSGKDWQEMSSEWWEEAHSRKAL